MIKREGICVVCKGKAIIAKRLPSGDLCFKHNQDRLWAKRQGKPKAPNIRTLRKPTGELIVFNRIYEASQGKCCITGDFLVFDIKNFAHVLSKAAYPSFRLLEENILHCRFEFHHLYDNAGTEEVLKKYPYATWVYELKNKLKIKYYAKTKNNSHGIDD